MGEYRSQDIFAEQVRKHFKFLLDDHGFSITHERYFPEQMGNSDILLQSPNLGIRCLLDRGQAQLRMGPVKQPKESWFDLSTVVEFLAPNLAEPVYVFPDEWNNYDDMTDAQVARMARIVREYCQPVLHSRFEEWTELEQFRNSKAEREYRNLTGREIPKRGSWEDYLDAHDLDLPPEH